MSKPIHDPLLIFVRGLPGSGKSYVTYALRDAIIHSHVTVIDPDYIDKADVRYQSFVAQLLSEGIDSSIIPFRWLRQRTVEAAQENAIIIWNQPFTNKGVFDRLIAYLKDSVATAHKLDLKVLVIEVNTPSEIAWKRVAERVEAGGHGPTKDTFAQRCIDYESYKNTYPVLELDGESDRTRQVKQILKHINSIL